MEEYNPKDYKAGKQQTKPEGEIKALLEGMIEAVQHITEPELFQYWLAVYDGRRYGLCYFRERKKLPNHKDHL
jgi:hypothetical protein